MFATPSPKAAPLDAEVDSVRGRVNDSAAPQAGGKKAPLAATSSWEEARPLDVVPSSPKWSVEDADFNRGTGVRRRLSPRAGTSSPSRAAGWAAPSPPSRQELLHTHRHGEEGEDEDADEERLRPLDLSLRGDSQREEIGELRIDVPEGEFARGAGSAERLDSLLCISPIRVSTGAKTPLAGARRAGVAKPFEVGPNDADADVATQATTRAVGLRCSSPIYDRGRNLLGNTDRHTPGDGENTARAQGGTRRGRN